MGVRPLSSPFESLRVLSEVGELGTVRSILLRTLSPALRDRSVSLSNCGSLKTRASRLEIPKPK